LAGPALAGCAEDLTRIQLALPSAAPDNRAAAQNLVSTAQARAKAQDGNGCTAATNEALKLLGLPNLAPLTLSTPVPGEAKPAATVRAAVPAPSASTPAQSAKTKSAKAKSAKADADKKKASAKAKTDPKNSPDWYVVTSNIVGSDVTAQDRPDESIGTIKALVIDSTTRQTTLALIETGGFLGISDKLIAVPFAALHFSGRWDRPTVRASLATLRSGPRVSLANVPHLVSNAKWRADLGKHFHVALAPPSPRNAAASADSAGARSTVGLGAASASAAGGDAAAGASYVQGMCGACHTLDQGGGPRVGPNLFGLLDRKIAAAPGFGYSAALKDHGGNWTAANLNGFLKNPQTFARGTTMPFAGISSDNERRNVIAYFETLGTAPGAKQ
jgi:cytochrome c